MKKTLLLIFLLLSVCSIYWAIEDDSYLIVPRVRIGAITDSTSELDLINLYGVENVVSTESINDQNETITETTLFPFDNMKTLHIIWTDGNSHAGPAIVRIEGPSTYWHTAEGISLGTSLIQLEIMNGTYFFLTGLNLEHPSTITDCGYGNLKFLGYRTPDEEGIKGKSLILRLDQPGSILERITNEEYASISGTGTYRSDDVVMEKLNPIVRQIDVVFPE
ncbi:MAG TPA: hypothetical protein PLE74_05535 [Candidatus Cloacimonadota bacterium]|nr:hypothetical protein [Candidatus Cloacimonadota bacterium]